MFLEVAAITLVAARLGQLQQLLKTQVILILNLHSAPCDCAAIYAARLGQFQQLLKAQVILILNFTRPHAITYTKSYITKRCKNLKDKFNINYEDLSEVYLSPINVCIETSLKDFQFKVPNLLYNLYKYSFEKSRSSRLGH